MPVDIDTLDIGQIILERLQDAYGGFRETAFEKFTEFDPPDARRYIPGDGTAVPFDYLYFATMRDVEIRNVFDREKLDRCNSYIASMMPDETVPLPVYVVDIDVHKGLYVHIITDCIMLSKDPDYRTAYEQPLKELKARYRDLPGLVLETPPELYAVYPMMKEFDTYSSQGKIFGNIPLEHAGRALALIRDYLDLFCRFARTSSSSDILTRDAVRREAAETKKSYLGMMARMNLSDDMPTTDA